MIKPLLTAVLLAFVAGSAPQPVAPDAATRPLMSSLNADACQATPAELPELGPLESGTQVSDLRCGPGAYWRCDFYDDGGWFCRCVRLGGNPI